MEIVIKETNEQLGAAAAEQATQIIREAIHQNGKARILLSTGASQFTFFEAFVKQDLEWNKVEMFHLDEYVHLPESHPASFIHYLKERFVEHVPMENVHFVSGNGDVEMNIRKLNEALSQDSVDLAMIGIGENSHIAFNDPPADFETEQPYLIVKLDDACKRQQVREGWFSSLEEVPDEAITMSVQQIMKSKVILSCVPHETKAEAVRRALENGVRPEVPASILKTHPNWTLYLDTRSSAHVQQ